MKYSSLSKTGWIMKIISLYPPLTKGGRGDFQGKKFAKVLSLVIALTIFFNCCSSKPIPPIKPPLAVAELELHEYKTGKEALREIFRLHGRKMGLINGYVANYVGKEGKATIYYSVAKDEKLAGRLIEWMKGRIGKSHEIFKGLKEERIGQQVLYSVYGQGMEHFFYCKADKVIWMVASPVVAGAVIKDFVKK